MDKTPNILCFDTSNIRFTHIIELNHYISEYRLMIRGNNKKIDSRTEERRAIKKLMKSLYFKKDLKRGHIVQTEDLCIKSPYDERGVSIYLLDKIIGMKLNIDVKEEQLIDKHVYLEMETA